MPLNSDVTVRTDLRSLNTVYHRFRDACDTLHSLKAHVESASFDIRPASCSLANRRVNISLRIDADTLLLHIDRRVGSTWKSSVVKGQASVETELEKLKSTLQRKQPSIQ